MNTDGWKMGCIGSRKLKYSQECDTLSIEQPCYRVADLYSYIEWGVVLMDKKPFDFKDLMAFGMFILALLTFVFTFIR